MRKLLLFDWIKQKAKSGITHWDWSISSVSAIDWWKSNRFRWWAEHFESTGKMADTSTAQNEVNLVNLSLEQLSSLKDQLEKELQQLTLSFGGLREAQSRFLESKEALESLAAADLDKDVLVPLTPSMFVPGNLTSKDEVLVDVGTGYFVEQSVKKAEEFMDRKVEFLQSNTEQLKTVIDGKRNMLEAVLMIMQQKMQEVQQIQQK